MKPIQVLVCDDSALMRRIISDILKSDPEIIVVGTAKNGQEALDLIPKLKPDVLTLDIEMPVLNGLEALPMIWRKYKIPTIMLSSLTQEGADATIKALELGAFDFVGKPSGSISLDLAKISEDLLHKIKAAAKKEQVVQSTKYFKPYPKPIPAPPKPMRTAKRVEEILAIGTSTGGPRALQVVLSHLPGELPAAVVVVQHMPAGFTKSLAQRLDQICTVRVHEAHDGQVLEEGHVYIAPGDYHMRIVEQTSGTYVIRLNQEPPLGGHRPAVDIMYDSVAELRGVRVRAAILTGMGGDGANGMVKIKAQGGRTIAESQESCVVFGMPRTAIAKGCVDIVAPLNRIADELTKPWKR
ncbi:protein-glutamate methylesterase/protein-glutamine glutaminase [Tumebacillus permanentifrigoris]|uniref:Protein-glutamate methylesterase/protein-glutamine glutaminase n=1 Tax=Tumebacillus permanentifrigoris TaxID=378543 RepID=A0A316DUG1_9BACL|nr:chemotaxis response regulator protein-glutamate methylesterase [Tumebacillus permanentifrigoris]PWK12692.1 two-component system chemotaxis response regulator CheB [Tumebacillus permanentifrigoris]